jgi:hypothetical protein
MDETFLDAMVRMNKKYKACKQERQRHYDTEHK